MKQLIQLIQVSTELAKVLPIKDGFGQVIDLKLTCQTARRITLASFSNSTGFSRWANIGCATCSSLALCCKTAGRVSDYTPLKVMAYPLGLIGQGFAVAADSFDGTLSVKTLL